MSNRQQYQNAYYVYVERNGRFYVYRWNGRRYVIDAVADYIEDENGDLLSPGNLTNSYPRVNFRVSRKDLEILSLQNSCVR